MNKEAIDETKVSSKNTSYPLSYLGLLNPVHEEGINRVIQDILRGNLESVKTTLNNWVNEGMFSNACYIAEYSATPPSIRSFINSLLYQSNISKARFPHDAYDFFVYKLKNGLSPKEEEEDFKSLMEIKYSFDSDRQKENTSEIFLEIAMLASSQKVCSKAFNLSLKLADESRFSMYYALEDIPYSYGLSKIPVFIKKVFENEKFYLLKNLLSNKHKFKKYSDILFRETILNLLDYPKPLTFNPLSLDYSLSSVGINNSELIMKKISSLSFDRTKEISELNPFMVPLLAAHPDNKISSYFKSKLVELYYKDSSIVLSAVNSSQYSVTKHLFSTLLKKRILIDLKYVNAGYIRDVVGDKLYSEFQDYLFENHMFLALLNFGGKSRLSELQDVERSMKKCPTFEDSLALFLTLKEERQKELFQVLKKLFEKHDTISSVAIRRFKKLGREFRDPDSERMVEKKKQEKGELLSLSDLRKPKHNISGASGGENKLKR